MRVKRPFKIKANCLPSGIQWVILWKVTHCSARLFPGPWIGASWCLKRTLCVTFWSLFEGQLYVIKRNRHRACVKPRMWLVEWIAIDLKIKWMDWVSPPYPSPHHRHLPPPPPPSPSPSSSSSSSSFILILILILLLLSLPYIEQDETKSSGPSQLRVHCFYKDVIEGQHSRLLIRICIG